MKHVLIVAAALCLTACASNANFHEAITEIASDPRCGHVDRIQGNLGGFGGNNLSVFLERTCPAAAQ